MDYDWQANPIPTSIGQALHIEKQSHAEKNIRFFRQVHKLDSTSALQRGSVLELEMNPTEQKLVIHRLQITRDKVLIDKLPTIRTKLVQMESQSWQYVYTHIWTLILIIDDIREGDILDYSYSYTWDHPSSQDIFLDRLYLTTQRPVKQLFMRLVANPSISLKYHGSIHYEADIQTTAEGLQDWRWFMPEAIANYGEQDSVPWHNPHTWVQASSFTTWEEVSEWACRMFEPPLPLSNTLQKQITEWRMLDSEEAMITTVIRFVQREVRYLSLDERLVGHGVAADPSAVFERRFGDCKDKTWLLCTILRELGIEAVPALVDQEGMGRSGILLPSLYFDHAILAIFCKGKTYWIDATRALQGGRFGCMASLPFETALLVCKPGKSLVSVQYEPTAKTSSEAIFDLSAGPKRPVGLSLQTIYYDQSADHARHHVSNLTSEELSKNYLNYFRRIYPQIEVVSLPKVQDQLDANVLTVFESYTIRDAEVKEGSMAAPNYLFELFPFNLIPGQVHYDIDLSRKSPLWINFPSNLEERITLCLPEKLKFDLEDFHLECAYYKYSESWETRENKVSCCYCLQTLKECIAVQDLQEVREFLQTIKNRAMQIRWDHPKPKIEKKTFRELVKECWHDLWRDTSRGDKIFYSLMAAFVVYYLLHYLISKL